MFQTDNGGHGAGSGTEVRLDEEMEKVFAMSGGLHDDKFDVSVLTVNNDVPNPSGTGENVSGSHRTSIPNQSNTRQFSDRKLNFVRLLTLKFFIRGHWEILKLILG